MLLFHFHLHCFSLFQGWCLISHWYGVLIKILQILHMASKRALKRLLNHFITDSTDAYRLCFCIFFTSYCRHSSQGGCSFPFSVYAIDFWLERTHSSFQANMLYFIHFFFITPAHNPFCHSHLLLFC